MVRTAETVIVGASIGGVTTAETLRVLGYEGAITVVGDEVQQPYNRPPLSKQVLVGEWEPAQAIIASPERIEALGIELVLGVRATGLRPDARVLETSRDRISYDQLVIATGVTARQPAGRRPLGVHTLRTVEDAVAIRLAARNATRILVVGAGILGSEIAAGLSKTGAAVTLVGRSRDLRFGQVGSLVSPLLQGLHRTNGVELRLGVDVVEFLGDSHVEGALLSDGSILPADLVIAAIGSTPNTGWVDHILPTGDGILCDARGRVAADVYAVGDVARWTTGSQGESARVEHQQNAIEQAHRVARSITTGDAECDPILPFFWSELYGTRIQAYGRFDASTMQIIAGDVADSRFVAAAVRDGAVRGVLGWNMPRAFRDARFHVDASTILDPHRLERQLTP